MKHLFSPRLMRNVGSIKHKPTVDDLTQEPMLFSSSINFARVYGGPLTQMILDKINPEERAGKNIIIDTRIHMLMEGMYPAIPGWHCDNFPRSEKYSQPDLEKFDPQVENIACLLSNVEGGVSSTEFAESVEEVDVDPKRVWQSVDLALKEKPPRSFLLPDGDVIWFNQNSPHRAQPCHNPGWRMFFRLSYVDREPANKIRQQVQVYTTESQGW